MTACATVRGQSRFCSVKAQVVVGMHAAVTHAPVVALDALALAMTREASRAVDARCLTVVDPKVGVMVHAEHPGRGVERPLSKLRAHDAVSFGQMARATRLSGAPLLVTADAFAHRRKVKSRRELLARNAGVTFVARYICPRV